MKITGNHANFDYSDWPVELRYEIESAVSEVVRTRNYFGESGTGANGKTYCPSGIYDKLTDILHFQMFGKRRIINKNELLRECPYWSQETVLTFEKLCDGEFKFGEHFNAEHMKPVNDLWRKLVVENITDIQELAQEVSRFPIVIVTKDEHKKLGRKVDEPPFERYRRAGISISANPLL